MLHRKHEKYCLSQFIKTFIHKSFVFSSEKNWNIINEGEQLPIHLVRPTTKEEKITHSLT